MMEGLLSTADRSSADSHLYRMPCDLVHKLLLLSSSLYINPRYAILFALDILVRRGCPIIASLDKPLKLSLLLMQT